MARDSIRLVYDGGDANRHIIDAKLFGQSLQGLDRMVSDVLIILSQERLPKRGERAPLLLKAGELEAGSVSVPQILQDASELLGLGVPILSTIGSEIVSHYVSAILNYFKGNKDAAESGVINMAEMHRDALQALNRSQEASMVVIDRMAERSHVEAMGMQDLLRTSIMGSGSAAVDYVAPIGRSVDTASFLAGAGEVVVTNKDDAEAIRDSQKLEWQSPRNEIVITDGFKFHSSALSIHNPDSEGFLMAEVHDPVFETESNPYTVEAQKREKIEVLARRGYKNGVLSRIMILDFIREI